MGKIRLVLITEGGAPAELAMPILANEHAEGSYLQLEAVVTSGIPTREKARILKGEMRNLGLDKVPIASGGQDYKENERKSSSYYSARLRGTEYRGQDLLSTTLALSGDSTITVIATGRTEMETLIRQKPKLLSHICKLVIPESMSDVAALLPSNIPVVVVTESAAKKLNVENLESVIKEEGLVHQRIKSITRTVEDTTEILAALYVAHPEAKVFWSQASGNITRIDATDAKALNAAVKEVFEAALKLAKVNSPEKS